MSQLISFVLDDSSCEPCARGKRGLQNEKFLPTAGLEPTISRLLDLRSDILHEFLLEIKKLKKKKKNYTARPYFWQHATVNKHFFLLRLPKSVRNISVSNNVVTCFVYLIFTLCWVHEENCWYYQLDILYISNLLLFFVDVTLTMYVHSKRPLVYLPMRVNSKYDTLTNLRHLCHVR